MLKINIKDVLEFLVDNKCKYKKVVLQAPNGLRNQLLNLYEEIMNSELNIDVYISGTRNFGACDIAYEEAARVNADIIIHFGHTQFPYSREDVGNPPKIPVKYFPVYDDREVDEELIHELYAQIQN